MQRIKIFEKDNTTNVVSSPINIGSVLIPGFADKGDIMKPIECLTYSEFTSNFGVSAPKFRASDDNRYPVEFKNAAIPYDDGDESDEMPFMYNKDDSDPSWCMAKSLIQLGMPVVYIRMNEYDSSSSDSDYDVTVKKAYEQLEKIFAEASSSDLEDTVYSKLLDKNTYNIQFITSGGYPTLEYKNSSISSGMVSMASSDVTGSYNSGRGDAVALLDHTNNMYRPLIGPDSFFEMNPVENSSYASIFTPWCETSVSGLRYAPGSFIYLYNVASKLGASYSWSIYSGINNGHCNIVSNLNTKHVLTNKIAEYYQNDFRNPKHCSINAITYIRNYGYCIWGNRTCEAYTASASNKGFSLSFLNIRNLVSDVKKQAYFASTELMFEINNDVLWTKFKSKMQRLLDQMVSGYGLEAYKFVKNYESDNSDAFVPQEPPKAEVPPTEPKPQFIGTTPGVPSTKPTSLSEMMKTGSWRIR